MTFCNWGGGLRLRWVYEGADLPPCARCTTPTSAHVHMFYAKQQGFILYLVVCARVLI